MASETGSAQTTGPQWAAALMDRWGCAAPVDGPRDRPRRGRLTGRTWNGPPERVKGPYGKAAAGGPGCASTTGHEEPCGKRGRPRSKANYPWRPIADQYREGTVKRTPEGE